MLLTVTHPALVVHVPKGMRKSRLTHAAVTTPVEVATAALGTVRHVHSLKAKHGTMDADTTIHEHAGSLWRRLTIPSGGLASNRDLTHDEWFDYLSGAAKADSPIHYGLKDDFIGSPLVAFQRPGLPAYTGWTFTRGDDFDLSCQRSIQSDSRQAAGIALASYLQAETILDEAGGVLKRYHPVARIDDSRFGAAFCKYPHPTRLDRPAFRPDTYTGFLNLWNIGIDPEEYLTPQFLEARRALDGFEQDDEDLRALANWLPGEARVFLQDLSTQPRRWDELEGQMAILGKWESQGATGGIGGEEVAESLTDVRGVVQRALDQYLTHRDSSTWMRMIRHIDQVAPRLDNVIADEDIEAMAGLGMGA